MKIKEEKSMSRKKLKNILCYKYTIILYNMNFINSTYKVIKSKSVSIISLIIVTVLIDFIVSFNSLIYDMDNPLFKEFIFIFLGFF